MTATGTTILRGFVEADIAPVMALEHALFDDEAWTEGMLRDELGGDGRCYLVAEVDGVVVGYAGLCVYAEEAFIQTIGVAADQQRRGIGRTLLRALIAEADERDATALLLEVRADNVAAQALYAVHGFVPVGLRKGYYQPSGADAVVMRRERVGA